MSRSITVLGAGAVGVSTAIHLQQRGWQVTLVDRNEPGRETSYGNAGVINPGSCVPLNSPDIHRVLANLLGNRRAALRYDARYVLRNLSWSLGFLKASKTRAASETSRALATLTSDALEEHRALMQRTGNLHRLTEVGWLKVFRSGAYDPASFGVRLMAECGIDIEPYDAAGLVRLEPALKPIFSSGFVMPGGGLVDDPGALISEHARRFVADGGQLLRRDVRSLSLTGNTTTRPAGVSPCLRYSTSDASFACDHLVVAAGPWSADLLASAGFDVPLGIERGYHAHYHPDGEHRLKRSVHDVDAGYVMGPMSRGIRVTTGVELNARDAPSNLSQLDQVEPRVREAIAIGARTADPVWRGSRPTLPDSRPAIGAVPSSQGLWVNFGHQHIGLMTGPVSGKLLAQMISGEQPDTDMSPFSPARCLIRQWRRQRTRRSSAAL